ncbi:glycoside hydrolase [Streptomyces sp. WAC 01529]|uniref:C40 family peptidase n=1 Tax=Streptomyces sp. WAC 01529 TaxID=2203205 RepID=UPI000F6F2C87|nr:C40 family peptidase [Streptomyces sp. WAC 01529]AZM54972.1 glycoside hydrolase [Streptomyces sp. WAC 01529]
MASHRKPRARSAGVRTTPAVGITTAALTSVALLSQSAQAAPSSPAKPSLEEVRKKVDDLYHQAGVATQKYNSAKEKTEKQRKRVGRLLDDVAKRADRLNEARQQLGSFAAAQYRTGGASQTATMMLADDPQGYFDQHHLADRLTSRQKKAVDDYQAEQASATKQRTKAAKSLKTLSESRDDLRTSKRAVQKKLGEARGLLSELTAEEKARLAAIEREKKREAKRKAEELAREQAAEAERKREAEEAAQKEKEKEQGQGGQGQGQGEGSGSGSGAGSGSGSGSGSTDGGYATKAAKVIRFAEAQIGKPYVWGATGPDSYDCSGLTQDAWKAAGISLPRTTWDQVKAGTTVKTADAEPGDLVFFYDDISHVGIYIGDGKMIHAPKPGTNVRVESIYYMPIHSVVRPA